MRFVWTCLYGFFFFMDTCLEVWNTSFFLKDLYRENVGF